MAIISHCQSFVPVHLAPPTGLTVRVSANDEQSMIVDTQNNDMMDRRQLFSDVAIKTASTVGVISTFPTLALAEEEESSVVVESNEAIKPIGTDPQSPISIIGAGGKCGTFCTNILKKQGLYTRAITRSGRQLLSEESDYVSYASGDVTSYEAIKEAVKGSSGVIFAASASGKKKGGDPEHVDYLGLYNTAKVRFIKASIQIFFLYKL